jgi:hypothetical protein
VTPGSAKNWRVIYGNLQHKYEEFDLVIGANGSWSKGRVAIPGTSEPFYSGVTGFTFTIPHLSTSYPSLASLVGKGTCSVWGEQKFVVSQRGSLDSALIYLFVPSKSPSYLSDQGLDILRGAELKNRLLGEKEFFQGWGTSGKS